MEITLFNIQGFRGYFTYTLDEAITIINSKHNGVGKTTLYDCLRFLCDKNSLEKEEHKFFLNLNETNGFFSVTNNGVTHGFSIEYGRDPVFFKQYEGEDEDEDIEQSSDNFPEAPSDIGILVINGSILNIFSKELNLFSSSKSADDYQLVKEITTHEQTETSLYLLEVSAEDQKRELANLRREKDWIDNQLEVMPYFTAVEEMEELLNDDTYMRVEMLTEDVRFTLSKLMPFKTIEVSSKLEDLVQVEETLARLEPMMEPAPKLKTLELMMDVVEHANGLSVTDEEPMSATAITELMAVVDCLNSLSYMSEELHLDVTLLDNLSNLGQALDNLMPMELVDVDADLVRLLSNICVKAAEIGTNISKVDANVKLAESNRKLMNDTRIACPIRQEVYLVGGKCVYEGSSL